MKTLPPITVLPGRLLPAAAGISAALLLGGAGFALGCLYAGTGATAPAVASVPAPAAVPSVVAPAVVAKPAAPAAAGSRQRSPAPQPADSSPAMASPVAAGWVSSRFGPRTDPFTGEHALHRGLDFAGHDNSTIHAAASGLVTWSGRLKGYGNLIEIDHGQGWITRYGHNASNLVARGDYVKPGQPIALMGSTGRATGTHLHFEVLYQGRHQNPARFVPRET